MLTCPFFYFYGLFCLYIDLLNKILYPSVGIALSNNLFDNRLLKAVPQTRKCYSIYIAIITTSKTATLFLSLGWPIFYFKLFPWMHYRKEDNIAEIFLFSKYCYQSVYPHTETCHWWHTVFHRYQESLIYLHCFFISTLLGF